MSIRDKALKVHQNQKYGEHPYIYHLDKCNDLLMKFHLHNETREQAVYFHDSIEDQNITESQLVELGLNADAIDIVKRVTDEPGANRKERKSKTYSKIKQSQEAIIVKLIDRIANVNQSILDNNTKKFNMYLKEHKEFKKALYDPTHTEVASLWNCINHLLHERSTSRDL